MRALAFVCLTWSIGAGAHGQTTTGPATEQRFPLLVLPPGFKATLFACDPLVEYPSVIALGPKAHTLFVAHDYMTGLGTEIVRRDEIRLLEDTDGDGYADRSTVVAGGFNSIQGLAWHAGTAYAMHAPLLTALRDTDGDGVADERRDLLSGLGLPPEQNQTRLHCANGVVKGHDGWLYLALGDNGVDVPRPEGDRLVLHGGGILRCRPDGRDLHVLATGLRNIYDVALDAELNVFVRDNENDGGDYLLRVCHAFHGSDHGYPYLYNERPDEAMPPLAVLGRGSSAGVVCYLETAWPQEFGGNLLSCEWGRAVVRCELRPSGSGFAPTKEVDLAAGAAADPYGFKPTDLVVDRDGSLLVSDWCDGQRPKRGRGRIYRLTYTAADQAPPADAKANGNEVDRLLARLDSPSYHARVEAQEAIERGGPEAHRTLTHALRTQRRGTSGRLHAVWVLVHTQGADCIDELFAVAKNDPEPSVRAQAVRALADLTDPVLVQHRLDTGRGDERVAARLAAIAEGQHPSVLLEIVVALGRLRWHDAPHWLRGNLHEPDTTLAHAAMQTLRRSDNWPDVVKLLDEPDSSPMRPIALRAIADRADATIVDGLLDRLQREPNAARRQQYADLSTRVYKQPAPWVYWGYRPGPRPANTESWERTEAIRQALDRVLLDPDRNVRAAALRRMEREKIPTRLETLSQWLGTERDKSRVADILRALASHPFADVRDVLTSVARQSEHDADNRLAAVGILVAGLEPSEQPRLLELATTIEDGPVLARLLGELGKRSMVASQELLLSKIESKSAAVRGAAAESLAKLEVREAAARLGPLLDDDDVQVRRAAVSAAGRLRATGFGTKLLALAGEADLPVRAASLEALRQLGDPRAVAMAATALEQPSTQLAALAYLAEFGSREQAGAVARSAASSRSNDVLAAAVVALSNWIGKEPPDSPHREPLQEAIASLQGASGVVLRWSVQGPLAVEAAMELATSLVSRDSVTQSTASSAWRVQLAGSGDSEGRIELARPADAPADAAWVAFSDVLVAEATNVQFLASASGAFQVWVNERSVHQRDKPGKYQADSDRFEAQLGPGMNRLTIHLAATQDKSPFHLRFRRLGTSAEHERLIRFALQGTGSADRGREVFSHAEKSLCIKCHRVGDVGEKTGPELTGIGSRLSRVHLIESILEPSRSIAPSYETVAVALNDGRIIAGVRIAEDERTLTLGDDQGRKHTIAKAEIDERHALPRSTMPEGLEKRLSDREFLDLLTYLVSQKKTAP